MLFHLQVFMMWNSSNYLWEPNETKDIGVAVVLHFWIIRLRIIYLA